MQWVQGVTIIYNLQVEIHDPIFDIITVAAPLLRHCNFYRIASNSFLLRLISKIPRVFLNYLCVCEKAKKLPKMRESLRRETEVISRSLKQTLGLMFDNLQLSEAFQSMPNASSKVVVTCSKS